MQDIHFDRICRTSRSESYLISRGDEPFARVELHYTHAYVYGLLVMERDLAQPIPTSEILELKDWIDRELVETADMPRDDFILTVYQGKELGTFVDPDLLDEPLVDDGEHAPAGSAVAIPTNLD